MRCQIPNPLFDLAGILSGWYGVKFWTFFSATIIGKALIKANLQAMIVIVAFSDLHLLSIMEALRPILPNLLYTAIEGAFKSYRQKLQSSSGRAAGPNAAAVDGFVRHACRGAVRTTALMPPAHDA